MLSSFPSIPAPTQNHLPKVKLTLHWKECFKWIRFYLKLAEKYSDDVFYVYFPHLFDKERKKARIQGTIKCETMSGVPCTSRSRCGRVPKYEFSGPRTKNEKPQFDQPFHQTFFSNHSPVFAVDVHAVDMWPRYLLQYFLMYKKNCCDYNNCIGDEPTFRAHARWFDSHQPRFFGFLIEAASQQKADMIGEHWPVLMKAKRKFELSLKLDRTLTLKYDAKSSKQ